MIHHVYKILKSMSTSCTMHIHNQFYVNISNRYLVHNGKHRPSKSVCMHIVLFAENIILSTTLSKDTRNCYQLYQVAHRLSLSYAPWYAQTIIAICSIYCIMFDRPTKRNESNDSLSSFGNAIDWFQKLYIHMDIDDLYVLLHT